MKKAYTVIAIALFIAITMCTMGYRVPKAYAVTTKSASPSAQPTPTEKVDSGNQLQELKDRLATKVAELRTLVKRAMFGNVKTVSVASATVETSNKDIKIELGDGVKVAQMISGKRTTLTTDDISVNDHITVFGTYDATLDLLKAQYIFIESSIETMRVSGTVADVDTKDFTVTINTPEGRTVIVDVEKTTKASAWTKEGGIVKSGFSKIAVGDTVHVTGTAVPKKDDHISAQRILDLGDITGAKPSAVVTTTPTVTPSNTPKPTPTEKP